MALRQSARQSARSSRGSARATAPGRSGRASSRGGDEGERRNRPVKKKSSDSMIIIGGLAILGIMAITCIVIYSSRQTEKAQYDRETMRVKSASGINDQRVATVMAQAVQKGTAYCQGDLGDAKDVNLFQGIAGEHIYNVRFVRNYKQKKEDCVDVKEMFPGRDSYKATARTRSIPDAGISITLGYANEDNRPLAVATKFIQAKDGDSVNKGGSIQIFVYAEEELRKN